MLTAAEREKVILLMDTISQVLNLDEISLIVRRKGEISFLTSEDAKDKRRVLWHMTRSVISAFRQFAGPGFGLYE